MYENDVRRTAILGQYGTAVRSVRNCSENTNVYGVRPFTNLGRLGTMYLTPPPLPKEVRIPQLPWRWGIMYPQLPQGSCGYIAQWACKWKLKL